MSAAERLAALDDLPARDLLAFTEGTLRALVDVMNRETTLLRAARHHEAGLLTADKTRLAQDYVTYSRAVQRQLDRLKAEAPRDLAGLKLGHEQLATQIAENPQVSQPPPLSQGVTTEVPRTDLNVNLVNSDLALVKESVSLQELVDGLNALGISPRDLIAILQAIKATGALQAEIEVL
jgi:hypothetical protein